MNQEPIKDAIPSHLLQPDDDKFLKGTENFLIRAYYYLENGMAILNEFRNWFLGIGALYLALHLEPTVKSAFIMLGVAIPSLLFLIVAGYYNVHKLTKMKEWLSMRFSTHFGIKSFNFQQGQYELLVQIKKLLEQLNEKNK